MLQNLIMIGFYADHFSAVPSGLYLPGQYSIAVLVDEWIETTIGHQMQHWFWILPAFHIAYEMSVIGYLRNQLAPAEINLQQVKLQSSQWTGQRDYTSDQGIIMHMQCCNATETVSDDHTGVGDVCISFAYYIPHTIGSMVIIHCVPVSWYLSTQMIEAGTCTPCAMYCHYVHESI